MILNGYRIAILKPFCTSEGEEAFHAGEYFSRGVGSWWASIDQWGELQWGFEQDPQPPPEKDRYRIERKSRLQDSSGVYAYEGDKISFNYSKDGEDPILVVATVIYNGGQFWADFTEPNGVNPISNKIAKIKSHRFNIVGNILQGIKRP